MTAQSATAVGTGLLSEEQGTGARSNEVASLNGVSRTETVCNSVEAVAQLRSSGVAGSQGQHPEASGALSSPSERVLHDRDQLGNPPERHNPGETEARGEPVELFEPRLLRFDSRVLLAHTTILWLSNALWLLLIWKKLEVRSPISSSLSWWAVFAPTLLAHLLLLGVYTSVATNPACLVERQVGPPPPASAVVATQLAYTALRRRRERSIRVDTANEALEAACVLVTQMLFADALHRGTLADTPLRLIFTPLWVLWVVSSALQCLKPGLEVLSGGWLRSLRLVVVLLVALKVDDAGVTSWGAVFTWPCGFGVLMVAVACTVLILIVTQLCRCAARPAPHVFLVEAGVAGVLLSGALPHLLALQALGRRLAGRGEVSYQDILGPMCLSWLLMWVTSLVGFAGLAAGEARDAALVTRGLVWSAHEAAARRVRAQLDFGLGSEQRRVDKLSDEEISRLVATMVAGRGKPTRLRRVGEHLYQRVEDEHEQGQEGQGLVESGQMAAAAASSDEPSRATQPRLHHQPPVADSGGGDGGIGGLGGDGRGGSSDDNREGGGTSLLLPSSSLPKRQHLSVELESARVEVEVQAEVAGAHVARSLPAAARTTAAAEGRAVDAAAAAALPPAPPPCTRCDSGSGGSGGSCGGGGVGGWDRSRRTPGGSSAASLELQRIGQEEVEEEEGQASERSVRARARAPAALGGAGGAGPVLPSCQPPQSPPPPPAQQQPPQPPQRHQHPPSAGAPVCVICYDGEASCVFLECGHGGFCRRCAFLLFVRPPHECPTCRGPMALVVEIDSRSVGVEVGGVAWIKDE